MTKPILKITSEDGKPLSEENKGYFTLPDGTDVTLTEDIEIGSTEHPRRFDDIIEQFKSGKLDNFAKCVDEYNARTSKWSFWEYLYQEIKDTEDGNMKSDKTWKQAFELACAYINELEK